MANKNDSQGWQGYSVQDCDCKYCLHYGGRHKKELACRVKTCICEEERREAQRKEQEMKQNA